MTQLLLTLSSGLESDLHNRLAIANAGPFKMLVTQLRSESARVKQLAVALMAKLSGDSEENVSEIAKFAGIKPLVALLASEDDETQCHAAVVLADITRVSQQYAASVAHEGGIPLLVALLETSSTLDAKTEAAGALSSLSTGHAREVGEAGAIVHLVGLLREDSLQAQLKAASAIVGVAAGGLANQDGVKAAGGIELLVKLLARQEPCNELAEKVHAQAALALAGLANGSPTNQTAVAACGGIELLVALLSESEREAPKEEAAGALWSIAVSHHENQEAVYEAGGVKSLVAYIGVGSEVRGGSNPHPLTDHPHLSPITHNHTHTHTLDPRPSTLALTLTLILTLILTLTSHPHPHPHPHASTLNLSPLTSHLSPLTSHLSPLTQVEGEDGDHLEGRVDELGTVHEMMKRFIASQRFKRAALVVIACRRFQLAGWAAAQGVSDV